MLVALAGHGSATALLELVGDLHLRDLRNDVQVDLELFLHLCFGDALWLLVYLVESNLVVADEAEAVWGLRVGRGARHIVLLTRLVYLEQLVVGDVVVL